jgi:hypothetical protein
MIKKFIGWTLLGGLIVLLAAGAVNRTLAKTGDSSGGNAESKRGAQNAGETTIGGGLGYGQLYQNQLDTKNQDERSGYGQRGAGDGQVNQETTNLAQTGELEWYTFEGNMVSAGTEAMIIALEDNTTLEVGNRAWIYAQEQGFIPQPGDPIRLTGFYESDDHFEAGIIENLGNGESIQIRDKSGRPMWAGNRRGR